MSEELTATTKNIAVVQPQQSLKEFSTERRALELFIKSKMREGIDFGLVPQAKRPSLFAPGAEKISKYFGLHPIFTILKEVEEWNKGFFYYQIKCELIHNATGMKVGEALRSAHSFEKSFLFAFGKRRTPEELTQQQPNVYARAEKRSFVAGVKRATGASEIYDESTGGESADPQETLEPEHPQALTIRQKKLIRLFAVAGERGFSQENIKKNSKARYPVASMNDLTEAHLDELIVHLETTFEPVPKGTKPRRIIAEPTQTPQHDQKQNGGAEEFQSFLDQPQDQNEGSEDDAATPSESSQVHRMCAQCRQQPALENGFCSKSCQDLYYPPEKKEPWKTWKPEQSHHIQKKKEGSI